MSKGSEKGNPKVHNVRFYKPKPQAVYCMAMQLQKKKLALSRANASIEIWNLKNVPFIERTIASSTENFSVEGLAWCDSRLFSVGLHGLLIEYDLYKLNVKNMTTVTGEAAFCLDINEKKTHLAVGTEQGYLNIFQITEDELLFEKFLDKQEGRILCLKFDYSGEFIVSGSMDAVRIWSVQTNQVLHKLITGRSEQNKPTIVWCLAVTKDFTILSGDSRGKLTVWDGKIGAQIDSCQSHRADILSICLSTNEDTLYCAGVDPVITSYEYINVKEGTQKWVRSVQRKIHNHDVRALALLGNKLYSSGVDGYLACSYHPPKTLLKYPPFLQSPCVTLCPKAQFVMLRYPDFLEIWSLGKGGSEKDKRSGAFNLEEKPKRLALIQKVMKMDDGAEKNEGIICATISEDGTFIFYSTRLGSRLLKFSYEDGKAKLQTIEFLDDIAQIPCICAVFSANNRLILATNEGTLQIVTISNDGAAVVQNINTDSVIQDTVNLLTVSDQYLVVSDVLGNIGVWLLKNNYEFYAKLPKYKLSPTAVAIHSKLAHLVVAFSNATIIEYDLKARQLTQFSRALSESGESLTSGISIIKNITFDPRKDHVIILHDDDSVAVIQKLKVLGDISAMDRPAKAAKTEKNMKEKQPFNVRCVRKHKHLVHLSWLSNDEMVAVEVNPLSLFGQLPPCLVQSTYGRK